MPARIVVAGTAYRAAGAVLSRLRRARAEWLLNGFPIDETAEAFYFLLHRGKAPTPYLYHLLHWRGRGWQFLLFTEVMHHGVQIAKDGVLNLDLNGEKDREQGEYRRDQQREMLTQILVCSFVLLEKKKSA